MTWRNTPGALPHIVRPIPVPPPTPFHVPHIIEEVSTSAKTHKVIQRRTAKHKKGSHINTQWRSTCLTNGKPHIQLQNSHIISQMAMNMLLLDNLNNEPKSLQDYYPHPPRPWTLNTTRCQWSILWPGRRYQAIKTDEQPCDCGNLANSLRKRFRRDVSRWQ